MDFRDLAGNQIIVVDTVLLDIYGTFTLNYVAGWNLISIPVLSPMFNGELFNTAYNFTQHGAQMVSRWNGAGYDNFIPGFYLPTDPQNFALDEDEAYWVWMPGAGSIALEGERPGSIALDVVPGWNMVSYMDPLVVGDVETDWAPDVACGDYDDIAYYDGVTFHHYIFSGTAIALTPGRGYFVWSDGLATITYGS